MLGRKWEVLYSLQAVVVHLGRTVAGGHYVAYAKDQHGHWIFVDDAKPPRKVTWNVVERQKAYLLTYQKV